VPVIALLLAEMAYTVPKEMSPDKISQCLDALNSLLHEQFVMAKA
jgi:hypothetical protein